MNQQRCITMGASAGGVSALLELASSLPSHFPVPILFVHHIGVHASELGKLVSTRGPNTALTASEGDRLQPGHIYIAPADRHMLLEDGVIRLSRGPKEHHTRPAIDPLFRSAALACGPGAIGVVLTGMLDDGSVGLKAIKECGGTAVVQDPADALEPSMPESALATVEVDHVVPLASMGALLFKLARQPAQATPGGPPRDLLQEHALSAGGSTMEKLREIANLSSFTCPDCGGVLFELKDKRPVRYRCHTGDAFSCAVWCTHRKR